MQQSKQNLAYPDNLWVQLFGEEQPVPIDAAETLELLLQTDLSPIAREILNLRFLQGKTQAETSRIIGKRPERVRQITVKAIRDIRHPHNIHRNGATLLYGIAANKRIADGTADVCYVCGKLIEEDDPAFVVPGDDIIVNLSSRFKPVVKLCCCQDCALASINADVQKHEDKIMALLDEKYSHELAVQRLKDYHPEQLTLKDAHNKLDESQERVLSRSK